MADADLALVFLLPREGLLSLSQYAVWGRNFLVSLPVGDELWLYLLLAARVWPHRGDNSLDCLAENMELRRWNELDSKDAGLPPLSAGLSIKSERSVSAEVWLFRFILIPGTADFRSVLLALGVLDLRWSRDVRQDNVFILINKYSGGNSQNFYRGPKKGKVLIIIFKYVIESLKY